jgi:hypothetical protein
LKKEKVFDSVFLTLLLLVFQIYFGVIPGWKKITSDFPNYYVSAQLVREHKDLNLLYDNIAFDKKIKENGINASGQFIPYPPTDALLFLPFTIFKPLIAKRIWILLNIGFIFLCGFLIQKISNWNYITSLNTILISGFALSNDLYLGQIYLFLTALLLTGYLFFTKRNNLIPSFCWGIIMALKYLPVIFLPALILKKNWKTVFGILSIFAAINLVGITICGTVVYKQFINKVFLFHITGSLPNEMIYSIKYQSWDSLFYNLFMYDSKYNPQPVFDFQEGYVFSKIVIYVFLISMLIYFYHKTFKSKYFFETTAALSVFSLLFFEPGSATYHNLFLILPYIIILKFLINLNQQTHRFYFSVLFFSIGFLPTFLNKFHTFNGGNLFLSYNRLWMEMIFYFYSIFILLNLNKKNLLKT